MQMLEREMGVENSTEITRKFDENTEEIRWNIWYEHRRENLCDKRREIKAKLGQKPMRKSPRNFVKKLAICLVSSASIFLVSSASICLVSSASIFFVFLRLILSRLVVRLSNSKLISEFRALSGQCRLYVQTTFMLV